MTHTQIRRIVVNEVQYEWCIRGQAEYAEHLAIYKPNTNGISVHLDIIPWGLEIRPRTIAEVIEFSLLNGWVPTDKGQPLRIGYTNDNYIVLPEGCKNSIEYEKHLRKSGSSE